MKTLFTKTALAAATAAIISMPAVAADALPGLQGEVETITGQLTASNIPTIPAADPTLGNLADRENAYRVGVAQYSGAAEPADLGTPNGSPLSVPFIGLYADQAYSALLNRCECMNAATETGTATAGSVAERLNGLIACNNEGLPVGWTPESGYSVDDVNDLVLAFQTLATNMQTAVQSQPAFDELDSAPWMDYWLDLLNGGLQTACPIVP
jgi:hypothetical protein